MRLFIAGFLLFYSFNAGAAVQMKCISVGSGGDASITWQNSSSAALFRSYHIFHAVSGAGPFSLLDSITLYANQNYAHTGASANTQNAYYFVELHHTNGNITLSDTIQAIRLNVIDPATGYAALQWNNTHVPPIATNSTFHLIYREYPAGIFSLIDSVDITASSPSYLDEISICGDTLNYRIEIRDASGCSSVSSVDGDFFTDRISPSIPHMDSVSVDASGNAVIGWTRSSSNDTYAYVILRFDGVNWTAIDTVYGIGTTFYQSMVDATSGSEEFRLVAIDTCGNTCAADPLQQTIFLQGVLDRCSGSILLSWNAYLNSPSTPVYTIVMNKNGGGDVTAGTTGATSFTVTSLETDTTYCFRIVANLDGAAATSTSNPVCVTPDLPVAPQYSYIRSVSVFPNDVITITAYVDPAADIKEYHLQRSADATGNFVTVQSQPYSGISLLSFNDGVATGQAWYYRIASVDSCGNDAFPSQVCKSVSVDSVSSENFQNIIEWNQYQGWPGGIGQVLVYRSVDGTGNPSPLAVLSFSDSSLKDDVRELFSAEGEFCYYLVAYEAAGNPYGFADSARSNEICLRQQTSIYIPNAFRPEGVNHEFNPAEAFVSLEGYSFEVFNRFGEQIFETRSSAVGWDGNAKSHPCEMGVYVYRLKARDEAGRQIERIGRVTLIR